MSRFCAPGILALLAVLAAASLDSSGALFALETPEGIYEVLSPWAEVDPIPLRGISPRLDSLSGKKIGIFANYKRAAMPIAESLQKKLNAAYPDSPTSIFHSPEWNVTEIETADREKFTAWVKGLDAVILVVGD